MFPLHLFVTKLESKMKLSRFVPVILLDPGSEISNKISFTSFFQFLARILMTEERNKIFCGWMWNSFSFGGAAISESIQEP